MMKETWVFKQLFEIGLYLEQVNYKKNGVSQNIISFFDTIDPVVIRGVFVAIHNTIIQAYLRWKDGKSSK